MSDLQFVTLLYSISPPPFFGLFVCMCTDVYACGRVYGMLEDICWCPTHFSGLYPKNEL